MYLTVFEGGTISRLVGYRLFGGIRLCGGLLCVTGGRGLLILLSTVPRGRSFMNGV